MTWRRPQAPASTARRPSAWIVRGEDGRPLEVDLRPALAAAARWLSAWIRRGSAWIRRGQWYFLICLVLFLVLYVIGVAVLNYAARSYGLHRAMGWFIVVGVFGALLFLGLFEAARPRFHYRQILWALVVVLAVGWLAFVRFSGWRAGPPSGPGLGGVRCLPGRLVGVPDLRSAVLQRQRCQHQCVGDRRVPAGIRNAPHGAGV